MAGMALCMELHCDRNDIVAGMQSSLAVCRTVSGVYHIVCLS